MSTPNGGRARAGDGAASDAPGRDERIVAADRQDRPRDRWALGLLFCVIVAAIVIYLFVQGIRYLRPNLLVSRPEVGYTENQTGGFLDPMIGTLLVAVLAMAIAVPARDRDRRLAERVRRPTGLARVAESTIEMFAGSPLDRARAVRHAAVREPRAGVPQPETSGGVVYGRSFFAAARDAVAGRAAAGRRATSARGCRRSPATCARPPMRSARRKIATTRRDAAAAARPSVVDRCDARRRPHDRRHGDDRRPARRDAAASQRVGARSAARGRCAEPEAR